MIVARNNLRIKDALQSFRHPRRTWALCNLTVPNHHGRAVVREGEQRVNRPVVRTLHLSAMKTVEMKFMIHLRRVIKDNIRIYFAPLTGAFKGMRAEWRRIDREIQRKRPAESKAKKDAVRRA